MVNVNTASIAWYIIGASVAGTSHVKQGHGCDDAYSWRQLANGTLVIAVADGAGSARYSAEGARVAVEGVLKAVEYFYQRKAEPVNEQEWKSMLEQILQSVRTKLEELPKSWKESNLAKTLPAQLGEILGEKLQSTLEQRDNIRQNVRSDTVIDTRSAPACQRDTDGEFLRETVASPKIPPMHDFATTLLVALVTPQWIAIAQIGDGVIVVQLNDWTLQVLTQPDHGEYVNQTSFITDPDYLKRTQYAAFLHRSSIEGIALLTDGLENLAFDFTTKTPHERFFTPLFSFAARQEATQVELEAFLESGRVCKHTDDDKTIVLAVRP